MAGLGRLCGILLIAGLLAWQAQRVPVPQAVPAEVFSAQRAMQTLEAIAQQPHPTGSAEARRVRDRLRAMLEALLLQAVQVQHTAVAYPVDSRGGPLVVGAYVDNLVAVLPATGPATDATAILLMAHYDTTPGSPGAADDSLGIAAILEAVRALQQDAHRRHDVIVLFTDAEEAGLLGAQAFFGQHPLAARVGFVINLEARGSRGRALMFETSPGNGATVQAYADGAVAPVANSPMGFVYRRMPNGSDFSIPAARGIPGLNLAITGGQFDYHAATATPANLDRGSVQHMGDELLSTLRVLQARPQLPAVDADRVYSDLLGLRIWHHSPALGGWIVLGIVLSLAFALWRRRAAVTRLALLRGALFGLWTLTATALVARTVFRLLGGGSAAALTEGRALLARFTTFAVAEVAAVAVVVLLGLIVVRQGCGRALWWGLPLLAAGLCSLVGGVDALTLGLAAVTAAVGFGALRATPPEGWAFGLLCLGSLGAVGVQGLAPELLPVIGWPLLLVALAAGLPGRFAVGALVSLLCVTLAQAHLLHFGTQLFIGVGYGLPEALALVAMLSVIVLAPWLGSAFEAPAARWWLAVPAVVALAAMAWLWRDDGSSERYLRISQVFYLASGDATGALRVSPLPVLDPWSRQVLGPELRRDDIVAAPFYRRLWVADAPPVHSEPSRISLQPEAGAFLLRIVPPPQTREMRIRLRTETAVREVSVEGIPVPLFDDAAGQARLRWQAPPVEGLALRFASDAAVGRLAVEVAAFSDPWPGDAPPLPARDARTMPWDFSDGLLRLDRADVVW